MEYYEYALKIGKMCAQMCPESFEVWNLIAKCYIGLSDVKMTLVALDMAPIYPDIDCVKLPVRKDNCLVQAPEQTEAVSIRDCFMLPPNSGSLDFAKYGSVWFNLPYYI